MQQFKFVLKKFIQTGVTEGYKDILVVREYIV